MPSISGRIFIKDNHNNLIGQRKLEYVTHDKWNETERADIIAFLEKHLTEGKQVDSIEAMHMTTGDDYTRIQKK